MLFRNPSTILLLTILLAAAPIGGAEVPEDVGLRFSHVAGQDAVQPGCTTLDRELNPCHQIATSMNGLDSPKVDVLILAPASPMAERDLRIMRQSVQMWADGIDWMAQDMGLQWLADGVEFRIFVHAVDNMPGSFTAYPIMDPEIVVIASNPVGGIGIGFDPLYLENEIFGLSGGEGPCHGVKNPFEMSLWMGLPGFDSHHGGRSGTYVEDCDGAGGNICFSVNAAVDPETSLIDIFQLYDLVSHETGHCLTLGHVGDGAEGSWSSVPTNDIMAYHSDPPGLSKCVSSLNVEAFAVTMSKYLDVDSDGNVTPEDRLYANDAEGSFDDRPFQIQHPDNHHYASSTRQAMDCPQPDMGPMPLSETLNFTPDAAPRQALAIVSPVSDAHVAQGLVHVAGRVAGAGGGEVTVSFVTLDDFLNGTMGEAFDNATEVTVPVGADGRWGANIDLSGIADGRHVLVSAVWSGAEGAIDSDRVALLVNATVPVGQDALDAAALGAEGADSADAPGFAIVGLLAAVGAVLAVRRK